MKLNRLFVLKEALNPDAEENIRHLFEKAAEDAGYELSMQHQIQQPQLNKELQRIMIDVANNLKP